MHGAQPGDHFEFDDDLILDQQVGCIFADNHVVVEEHDPPLLHDAEPGLSHLMRKGVLIDLLNEPMTERTGNAKSTPNDPFGDRRPKPHIPFIHLHPANPP